MKLIADSGSTKTDWCLLSDGKVMRRIPTQGINPFHQDVDAIKDIMERELLPGIGDMEKDVDSVFFYGAGCTGDKVHLMEKSLRCLFAGAGTVEVHSDMMAAARSLFGRESGVACILGTGSNSCLYDGVKIVANIPPLGYVLGDEGSGAVLGRLFFNAIFKGGLPAELRDMYLEETGYTYNYIIDRVYRKPLANRFLASVSHFVNAHKTEYPQLGELVVRNFRDFFSGNVAKYGSRGMNMEIGAVGSVAYCYEDELRRAAAEEGYTVGRVEKSPVEGLLRYHS